MSICNDKNILIDKLKSSCDTLWSKYNKNHNINPEIRACNTIANLILSRHYSKKDKNTYTGLEQLCCNITRLIDHEKHENITTLKLTLTRCLIIYIKSHILYNSINNKGLYFLNTKRNPLCAIG